MRNVNAVMEARGFYLTPAEDMSGKTYLGVLAPTQAFEIVRPNLGRLTIGRLYTSCTCVQLVSPKRNFEQGERAVLELRNVRPTPPEGQRYALYVQITSPIRTTLRIDTFVRSSQFVSEPEPRIEQVRQPATTLVEELALEAEAEKLAVEEAMADAAGEVPTNRIVLEAETAAENAVVDLAGGGDAEQPGEAAPAAEAGKPAAAAVAAAPAAGGVAQRISIITLGVADLSRSIKFYEDLGWKPVARGKYDNIAFFQMNGQILSLYPLDDLLGDQYLLGTVTPKGGGVTLAILVNSREEVENTFQRFVKAGGNPLKHPVELPSGAITGYIADPDGHSWEISSVPQFHLNAEGELWVD
ncbi:MAG: VOC family protein [Planctomycetota bacterium]|nr:VOC family protein [Planctomycetota bacterium]